MTTPTTTPSAHTAGPWLLANHNEIVADNEHETLIAEVFDEHDMWRANARLIAAAPELLEYCKMLLQDVEAMAEDPDNGSEWDWSLTESNLQSLIAKVEGK